jgi:hypothetical protein
MLTEPAAICETMHAIGLYATRLIVPLVHVALSVSDWTDLTPASAPWSPMWYIVPVADDASAAMTFVADRPEVPAEFV